MSCFCAVEYGGKHGINSKNIPDELALFKRLNILFRYIQLLSSVIVISVASPFTKYTGLFLRANSKRKACRFPTLHASSVATSRLKNHSRVLPFFIISIHTVTISLMLCLWCIIHNDTVCTLVCDRSIARSFFSNAFGLKVAILMADDGEVHVLRMRRCIVRAPKFFIHSNI